MAIEKLIVPDLGTDKASEIIEVIVSVGDQVAKEDTLIVIESEKATIEVPSDFDGTIDGLSVKVGDEVVTGDTIGQINTSGSAAQAEQEADVSNNEPAEVTEVTKVEPETQASEQVANEVAVDQFIDIIVPDLGVDKPSEIIEVLVAEGETLEPDQTLIVIESDKATIEMPAEKAGTLTGLTVKVGDKVSSGDNIGQMKVADGSVVTSASSETSQPAINTATKVPSEQPVKSEPAKPEVKQVVSSTSTDTQGRSSSKPVYAGPAVRRLAIKLGVDLADVTGTGPKKRILKQDVNAYVKAKLQQTNQSSGSGSVVPELPEIDFSKWGEVEVKEVKGIKKFSAEALHRAWLTIPHVTQFDHADITDMEAFRKSENQRLAKDNIKITPLAFLVKACAKALQAFPQFNASLSKDAKQIIEKKYINIGIAVDTPDGLVVPVIKNADKLDIIGISEQLSLLSSKARDKKLTPADMQGGCFSISSLGGIGGTAFTPIVNWPEVAILGVSKSQIQPIWQGDDFAPRLMLPLSLSYDHRVIDGADAARFTSYLAYELEDLRRLLL